MPRYQAQLSDGTVVEMESNHEPTDQEFLAEADRQKTATPGPIDTAARSAGMALFPGLTTAGGALIGGEIGAVGGPIGALIGTGIGALAGGILGSKVQEGVMNVEVPDFLQETQRGQAANPKAAFAGDVAGALATFRFDPTSSVRGLVAIPDILKGEATLAQKKFATGAATQLGMGVGFGVVNPLLEGNAPTWTGVGESTAMAGLLGGPRLKALHPTVPQPRGIPNAISQPEATAVHGTVPKPPGEGTGKVSVTEGGPRVRTEAQGVAQEAEIPLDAELAAMRERENNTPKISGNKEDGFTLKLHGKEETGFETEQEARLRAVDAVTGKRPMGQAVEEPATAAPKTAAPAAEEEGKLLSKEEIKANRAAEKAKSMSTEADALADQGLEEAKAEAAKIGKKVEIVDEPPPKEPPPEDDTVPFALGPGGGFMEPAGDTIKIHKGEFKNWFIRELYAEGLGKKQMMEAVRRRIHEERTHMHIEDSVPRDSISRYWQLMSPFERKVSTLLYHGIWQAENVPGYGDYRMGQEALRQRLQRLGGTTSEVAQTLGTERWTLKSLNVMADIVRTARRATTAGAEQQAIYNRIGRNIDFAKAAVAGPPLAKRRANQSVEDYVKENLAGAQKHAAFLANQYSVNAQEKEAVKANLIKAWKEAMAYSATGAVPPGYAEKFGGAQGQMPEAKKRRKPIYDPEQAKMFSAEMTARGVPGEETRTPEQAVSAEQAGAMPRISGVKIQEATNVELAKDAPSFKDFADWGKRSGELKPDQLRTIWEDTVWSKVMNATGEELHKLRKGLDLEQKFGSGPIPEKEAYRRTVRQRGKTERGPQEIRQINQSAIAEKLIRQATPRFKDLQRKTVGLDDIDFENARAEAGAYRVFTQREQMNPDALAEVIGDRARFSKYEPVSVTKRIVTLVDRKTGETYVVDAYKEGRTGIMVTDPSWAGTIKDRPHVPLKQAMRRYRIFSTALVREPVQNFMQKFEKLSDFENEIGKAAAEQEKVAEESFPGESLESRGGSQYFSDETWGGSPPPEGTTPEERAAGELPHTQISEGEGGIVQGPHAELVRGEMGIGRPGMLERSRRMPLTTQEVSSVWDAFENELGKVEDQQDMLDFINGLVDRSQEKPNLQRVTPEGELIPQRAGLSGTFRSVLSAVQKIARGVKRAMREENAGLKPNEQIHLTDEQIYERALNHLFEAARDSETRSQFIPRILGLFGEEVRPTVSLGYQPRVPIAGRVEPAERELTTLRTHGPTYDPSYIGPTQPRDMTVASPGLINGPEMLPPSVVEAMAKIPSVDQKGNLVVPEAGYERIRWDKINPTGPVEEYTPFAFVTKNGLVGPRVEKMPRHYEPPVPKPEPPQPYQTKLEMPEAKSRSSIGEFARENSHDFLVEMARYKNFLTTAGTRKMSIQDVFATRDGMDRVATDYAVKGSNAIRMASLGEKVATFWERKGLGSIFQRDEAKQIRRGAMVMNAAWQEANMRQWADLGSKRLDIKADRTAAWEAAKAAHKKFVDPHPGVELQFEPPTEVRPEDFQQLIIKANRGIRIATDMLKSPDPESQRTGRGYLEAAQNLKADAEWTRDHHTDARVQETFKTFREVMDQHLSNIFLNGGDISGREYYVPGRYEGDFWDDGMITWGDRRVLGTQHRLPKTFDNYYEAIAHGPYVPITTDVADLAQNSLHVGMSIINQTAWLESFKGLTDPASKKPIGLPAVATKVKVTVPNKETGELEQQDTLKWQSPKPEYELILPNGRKATPVAIRRGYVSAVRAALAISSVPEMPVAKQLLQLSQVLKHGLILVLDTFHPGRLMQYSAALGGKPWSGIGRKGGWSALTFDTKDLQKAVNLGLIPKESMEWALAPITVYDKGAATQMTRHDAAQMFLLNGLNANMMADALYRNVIQNIPLIGERYHRILSPLNRWTFDRLTPGLIMESAMRHLEKQTEYNRANEVPLERQMRTISRDINSFFGNMGRQGVFRNPTFRDFMQLLLLAPMWQEGLIRKEVVAAGRLATLPKILWSGDKGTLRQKAGAHLGPVGSGVGLGLLVTGVLTQLWNLATRGHFTWDNPEHDHKMDTFIPLGDGKTGLWLSPFGTFAELSHDLSRLMETKDTAWEALTRLGINKMGPLGRIAAIMYTMETPTGQKITSTAGVAKAVGNELTPAPISLGATSRYIGHKIAPGEIGPNRPGVGWQRAGSLLGIKTQISTLPEQDISRMAKAFIKANNLSYDPIEITPTDQESYSKLRGAIRNEDWSGAKDQLEGLRKHGKTDKAIIHAMKEASIAPFTGSRNGEKLFLFSLSNKDLNLYWQSNMDRAEQYSKWINWYLTQ